MSREVKIQRKKTAKEGEVSFELDFERRRILGFYMTSPKFASSEFLLSCDTRAP